MDDALEKLLRGFRVEVPDQLGGVLDIGEHDSDLFAFAFQGTTAGEDFLGQVFRGV
ncbi:MAG: hypothetical protein O7G88_09710 [bacterium]|nr:hypothetical protein [bacterium]